MGEGAVAGKADQIEQKGLLLENQVIYLPYATSIYWDSASNVSKVAPFTKTAGKFRWCLSFLSKNPLQKCKAEIRPYCWGGTQKISIC